MAGPSPNVSRKRPVGSRTGVNGAGSKTTSEGGAHDATTQVATASKTNQRFT